MLSRFEVLAQGVLVLTGEVLGMFEDLEGETIDVSQHRENIGREP